MITPLISGLVMKVEITGPLMQHSLVEPGQCSSPLFTPAEALNLQVSCRQQPPGPWETSEGF